MGSQLSNVTTILAEAVAGTQFARLPEEVVAAVKRFTLSTLGSAVAGVCAAGCGPVLDLFTRWGGAPESTVVGAGIRLPAPHAAMLNAMYAQASDFDDVHERALVRPYSIVIPAVVAASEGVKALDGRAYVAAVAAGVDLTCRIGLAAKAQVMNWSRPSTLGTFGAAAAVARALELDPAKVCDAIGIAYSQVAGTSQPMIEGALVKRVQPGFAARAGVTAAMLAARGVTGPAQALEGLYGYFSLYEHGSCDPAPLLEKLRERWHGPDVVMKAYPCAAEVHPVIDAALKLAHTHDLHPEHIASLEIMLTPTVYRLCGRPYPPQHGSKSVAALASAVYAATGALVYRSVSLVNYTEQAIADPRVLRLAALTEVRDQPGPGLLTPASIEVRMLDGAQYQETVTVLRGSQDWPLSWDQVIAKFRDCCRFSGILTDAARQNAFIERVAALEYMEDVGDLTRTLVRTA